MKIKKLLILRFGAIGDVVHSTALFRSIKAKYPEISIHYACFKAPSSNIINDPDLEKVWILPGKSYAELQKAAMEMKNEKFDAFINLQPGIRTRIFALMLGMPKTITYRKTFKLHAVENFWQTGKKLFKDIELPKKLNLYIKEETKNKVSDMLDKKTHAVGFNMGVSATRQGRRWPQAHWAELAKIFLEKYDCEIILTGSHDDKEFSEAILEISPKIKSFCGKLSLEENTALLSLLDIVISGDTGPLHIATAVGTAAIGLYGAAPVSRTGPYGENCKAIFSERNCVPCNRRKCKFLKQHETYTPCMTDIDATRVFRTAELFMLEKY